MTDQARYFLWLVVFLVGCLLYVVETAVLRSAAGWIEWVIAPLWLVLGATILIITSALSPAYAVRRARRIEALREPPPGASAA
ncbi:MAG TPA: hypothetical protein VII98_04485 [Solirubrobacteraceae bacterium]